MTEPIKQQILEKGCYSPDENLRIYNKWFAVGLRHMFRAVDRKYDLRGKVICDVGCAYGMNLLHCQPGSYGIEIDEYQMRFAQSIGLDVYNRDVVTDDLSDLPQVDAVWCSAVLEHVESPHLFLRKIAQLLKPEGLVVLYVPTIPLMPIMERIPGLTRLTATYRHGDHVNAFVPSTLQFFCERAGFKTLQVSPFYPPPFSILNRIPYLNRLVSGSTFVGSKIPNWDYPVDASRTVHPSKAFVYKHQGYKTK